jgi:hypothetical protein
MTETKHKKWWTNWSFWLSSALVIFFGYKYLSDYLTTKNSEYGRLANARRQSMGIPAISDYLKPTDSPTDKYEGIRWETNKNPTLDERLIHRWKNVTANKTDGWLEERDALRFYIDDTTCFQLNLVSKIFDDSVVTTGQLGKVDTRKVGLDLENKYPRYEWTELEKAKLDSIRDTWTKLK